VKKNNTTNFLVHIIFNWGFTRYCPVFRVLSISQSKDIYMSPCRERTKGTDRLGRKFATKWPL